MRSLDVLPSLRLTKARADLERFTHPTAQGEPKPSILTGWLDIDAALVRPPIHGGLTCGMIHEWFGLAQPTPAPPTPGNSPRHWLPPLGVLIHLAMRALASPGTPSPSPIFWVGRRVWPYPPAMGRRGARALLHRSIFVDARDLSERVWAMDVILRSPGTAALVADASGLTMAASRRLQLAAAQGSALALLARPPWELDRLSAASTRWLIAAHPSPDHQPRWTVQLLRCKGLRPTEAARHGVRQDHETGALTLDADVRGRSCAPSGQASRRTA